MDLPEFHMKYLLQEGIEVIIEKEFSFTVEYCVRGYHIFQSFWEAPVGSVLIAKHQDDPQSLIHDKFAVALVNNDSLTVGHIPKFMSKLTYFFLKHGGHMKCEITGGKKYSKNLEQGGLEIPARLTEKKPELPLFRSTEESKTNQISFRALSILYITNFSQTKINSNAIRVLFLLLNFRKSRKCALN